MCGIVGGVRWIEGGFNEVKLKSANKLITHRGPDGSGVFVKGEVGLASRRLAIIDIKGGKQPMKTEDGSLICVYNGEIYNFRELRQRLERRGYRFRTKSDTEVLLYGWQEWAGDLFGKLNGMFAVAIWDSKRKTLVLGRDHAGIKPLYYYQDKTKFIFASEIKSLFCFDGVRKKMKETSVLEFLALRYPLGNQTMYENIFRFPAASWGEINEKKLNIQSFWEYPHLDENVSWEDAVRTTRKKLRSAVSAQLMSDVPLGVFLSGGLDSSAIVSMAVGRVKKLNTISVGFADSELSELSYAREVSRKFGTKHTEVVIDKVDYLEELENLISIKDEPLAVQNEVAIYLMSRELKKNFTVVLSGEGADEMFGGYPKYFNTQKLGMVIKALSWLPLSARKTIATTLPQKGRLLAEDLVEIIGSAFPNDNYFARWSLGVNRQSLAVLTKKNLSRIQVRVEQYLSNYFELMEGGWQDRFLHYDYDHHLANLLDRVDKMTMAASVEARVPFLDKTVVDYVGSLPMKVKCQGQPKALLKAVIRGILPDSVIDRQKVGFPIPIKQWMKQKEFRERCELLLRRGSLVSEYCQRAKLKKLIKNVNNDELLFKLLNLELWYKMTWK